MNRNAGKEIADEFNRTIDQTSNPWLHPQSEDAWAQEVDEMNRSVEESNSIINNYGTSRSK